MEPCTAIGIAIAFFGALAGLFTAGSQVASATSQIRGTAKERDAYRQKSETIEKKLETTEKQLGTIQEESQTKGIVIIGLMALLAVVYQQLLEAQERIAEKDAELAKVKSERDRSRKTVKNTLRYGVPAVVLALVLVFIGTKQYDRQHSTPTGHITTSQSVGYSASR